MFARAPPGPDPLVAFYKALMEACLTVLRGQDVCPDEEAVYRPAIADLRPSSARARSWKTLVEEMTEPRPLGDFFAGGAGGEARRDGRRSTRSGINLSGSIGAASKCGRRARLAGALRRDHGLAMHGERAEPCEGGRVMPSGWVSLTPCARRYGTIANFVLAAAPAAWQAATVSEKLSATAFCADRESRGQPLT